MKRDEGAAARAVEAAMGDRGWNTRDLAREADADPGTVGDFLAGTRWPRPATRGKIERALGWPAGAIRAVSEGEPPPGSAGMQSRPDLAALIATEPSLNAAARAHFLAQFRLLQRLSAMDVNEDSDEQRIRDSDLPQDQKDRAIEQLRRNRERRQDPPEDHKEAL